MAPRAPTSARSRARPVRASSRSASPVGPGSGTGSGVIISEDGYVVTNNHVVDAGAGADISVRLNDGRDVAATVVGTDPTSDLAVIKLEGASDLTPDEWGDSSRLEVGDVVVAIGSPLGLDGTLTSGVVSTISARSGPATTRAPKRSSTPSSTTPRSTRATPAARCSTARVGSSASTRPSRPSGASSPATSVSASRSRATPRATLPSRSSSRATPTARTSECRPRQPENGDPKVTARSSPAAPRRPPASRSATSSPRSATAASTEPTS